jgi:very-long-chain (3R)-3-hydroxyacyl-CoA dehydratase
LYLQIDFDRWKTEDDIDDEEPRDVMDDYPDLYEKLQKEELGYRKGRSQTVILL